MPLRVFSFKTSTVGIFTVPVRDLRGEEKIKPRPQSRILVAHWSSFENLQPAIPVLFIFEYPFPGINGQFPV